MDILILGGTNFLGPHIVEAAQAHGHRLTLFNRGRRELFPTVENIRGDRNSDLALLQGRHWDAVIDTSGYIPRTVRLSAEALAHAVERYIFISTISVYADFSKPGMDESAPLATLTDTSVEEVTDETYGGLKVLCEQAVEQALPGRALLVRPGFIASRMAVRCCYLGSLGSAFSLSMRVTLPRGSSAWSKSARWERTTRRDPTTRSRWDGCWKSANP